MKRLSSAISVLLVAWVATLPIQTRFILRQGFLSGGSWEYGTVSLYATDILLLLAIILTIFSRPDNFWQLPKKVPGVVLAAVVGVLIATFSSILQATKVGVAANIWSRMVFGALAWWLLLKSQTKLSHIAVGVVISASLESVLAFVQFFQQQVVGSTLLGMSTQLSATPGVAVIETSLGRFLRAYGTLPHPNMLAGWLVLGSLFCIGLYLRSKETLERSVLLILFLVIQFGLFLSFSRGALLAWLLLFLFLVVAVLTREQRHRIPRGWFPFHREHPFLGMKMLKLTIGIVLSLGMFTAIFAPLVAVRTGVVGRLERLSVDQRFEQLDDVQRLASKHWLFGVGVGNYTKALHDDVDAKRDVWKYQPVHNVFLLLFAELGVLGTLVVLWAILVIIETAIRAHRAMWHGQSDQEIPWLAIGSTVLLAILLISLVDHYFWSLPFGIMAYWAMLGFWTKAMITDN